MWRRSDSMLRKIGQRVLALHELSQSFLHSRPHEKFTEDINLAAQFVVGNRFDEALGSQGRASVELFQLGSRFSRDAESVSFGRHLADNTDCLGFCRVDASAGENQVANDCVSQVAFEARNTAKPWYQPQTQFRKTKARHFVRDDQIACKR